MKPVPHDMCIAAKTAGTRARTGSGAFREIAKPPSETAAM